MPDGSPAHPLQTRIREISARLCRQLQSRAALWLWGGRVQCKEVVAGEEPGWHLLLRVALGRALNAAHEIGGELDDIHLAGMRKVGLPLQCLEEIGGEQAVALLVFRQITRNAR